MSKKEKTAMQATVFFMVLTVFAILGGIFAWPAIWAAWVMSIGFVGGIAFLVRIHFLN